MINVNMEKPVRPFTTWEITRFETYRPLTLSAKEIYDEHAAGLPEAMSSPLYFQSLFGWNFASGNKYKIIGGYLCMVAHDTVQDDIFALPPIGLYRPDTFSEAIDAVYEEFAREGLRCVFNETPGFMLPYFSSLRRYDVHISHDEDWSDYMFTREDFMSGIYKRSSREAIRNFMRKFNPVVRDFSPADIDAAVSVTKRYYCRDRDCSDCLCGCEVEVVSRLAGAWGPLDLRGVLVEAGGEPIAFEIACFQKETMLFLSKKVRHGTRGLNEFLNAELMERFGAGCKYVNYSDDMGNSGLRFYKSKLGTHVLAHRNVVELRRAARRDRG